MSIIQISKIQQRSGNLVDLPQLDQGEFGWASDYSLLFIGKAADGGNIENVEVLTSYSNISFSQINGAEGNLDISNVYSGQILTYVSSTDTWVNAGGNALDPDNTSYYSSTPIHLGDVSTLKIGGGGIGYILETDGAGNLSWTPKGTLYTRIVALSNANPIVMTVANTTPYTNDAVVTITGVQGTSNSIVNGDSFYIQLANDFPTSGNVSLYTAAGGSGPVDGAGLTYTNSPNAIATSVIAGGGGGGSNAQGSNTTIQFNNNNLLDGSANLTFDFANNIFYLNGNANISNNITAGGLITATGNISGGNITTAGVVTATGNVTGGNITTAGVVTATGNVTGGNLTTAGVVTATGNVTGGNIFTSGDMSATGNVTANFFIGNGSLLTGIVSSFPMSNGNSNIACPSANGNINVSVAGNANVVVFTGTGINIAGTLSATGNASVLGIKTDNYYYANGVAISFAGSYSNSNVANYLPTFTGTIGNGTATHFGTTLTTGSNSTAGTITGNWTLSTGSRLQATYADLAEYYEADDHYEPGTILEFGGEKEVTIAEDGSIRVAGVVSTNPAYALNANCPGVTALIALQGRVPCKVRGKVNKGDLIISGGNGYGRPSSSPLMGSVIGKSLENFNGSEGIIEIAVGRL